MPEFVFEESTRQGAAAITAYVVKASGSQGLHVGYTWYNG